MGLHAPTYKNTGGRRRASSSRAPRQIDPRNPSGPANLNRPIPANRNSPPGAANTNSPPRQLPKPGWRPKPTSGHLRMLAAVSRYMNDRGRALPRETAEGVTINRITGQRLQGEVDGKYFRYRGRWRRDPGPDGLMNAAFAQNSNFGNPWTVRHPIDMPQYLASSGEYEFYKPDRDGDWAQWYNWLPDYFKPAGPAPMNPFLPSVQPQVIPNPVAIPAPRARPAYERVGQHLSPRYMTVNIPPTGAPTVSFQNNPGTRPPRGTRELKAKSRLTGFISGLLNTGTELIDLLGVFADAAGLKTNDPRQQAIELFYHGAIFRMDLESLIAGLIYNEIEDNLAGRFFGGANRRLRQDFGAYVTTLPF